MKPLMLMILDGFGCSNDAKSSAILQAKTPNLDEIFSKYPNTKIDACGLAVGLPEGQMGNSEVGHLNIGAGRIVYQELTRITKSIEDGEFFENPELCKAMEHVKKNGSALHLMGLLSDGGVHSHINHLFALIDMAKMKGLGKLYIHCFLDGRDVPPRCAMEYFEELEKHIKKTGLGKIAVISGRYYAMDRDKRWERVEKAYDAMTTGEGLHASTAEEAISKAYERDENDEFVQPTIVGGRCENSANCENVGASQSPWGFAPISDGDAVIMYNFRPDRARQITRAFVADDFDGFERKAGPKNLCYICMTQYDASMPNVSVAFPPQSLKNTLGEYLANKGMKQLRIAETEKYAHVTFFFNGGVEAPNRNEDRVLIPSPKVATYDLKPEMSAYEVTDAVIEKVKEGLYDVIILNFANADMVGHTGIMEAAIKAIETLDACVPRIVKAVLEAGGEILLTADHGNADCMLDEEGNVVTSHSLAQVPLIHIAEAPRRLRSGGKLADLAPTMLAIMGADIPSEMTGKSLLE